MGVTLNLFSLFRSLIILHGTPSFNPFHAIVLFMCPLKTSENQNFYELFSECVVHRPEMG